MTFEQAVTELAQIGGSRFRNLRYTLRMDGKESVPECAVYIHCYDWCKARTWRGALNKMRSAICAGGEDERGMDEAPTGDDETIEKGA